MAGLAPGHSSFNGDADGPKRVRPPSSTSISH
jgi:hypothetical protein